jgi:hypothetical protein
MEGVTEGLSGFDDFLIDLADAQVGQAHGRRHGLDHRSDDPRRAAEVYRCLLAATVAHEPGKGGPPKRVIGIRAGGSISCHVTF